MFFTGPLSLADGLRASLPPAMGARLREALASAATPGTCRKVGPAGEMAEVGLCHRQALF